MESIREEVWKKTSLCIVYIFNIADQTKCCTVSNTSYYCINSDRCKLVHKRFHSDPVVTKEHHGFFSKLMYNVYHLFSKFCNFSSLERLEITEFLGRNTVRIIHISLVDNKLRTEFITHFFLKLLQDIWAYRCGISIPVYIFFSCKLIEDQGKLMEECSETYYIYIWVCFQETAQSFQRKLSCKRLAHVKSHLRLYIFPVIYNCVVHMNRIPHNVSKEAYCIIMERNGINDHISAFLVITPFVCRNRLACCTVHNLPPALFIIPCIYF